MPNGFYKNPQEIWDAKKCERMARRIARDGMGTPYPFKGAVPGPYPFGFGKTRYNGGCIRPMNAAVGKRKWYPGEIHPLPKLAKGFKWVANPTWCWQIVKEA